MILWAIYVKKNLRIISNKWIYFRNEPIKQRQTEKTAFAETGIYTDLPRKATNQDALLLSMTGQMLTNFQNSFTSRLKSDCIMKRSQMTSSRRKRVAALPCKTLSVEKLI